MAATTLPPGVADLVPEYLGRQRWFAGESAPEPGAIEVLDCEQLAATAGGAHRLLWALVGVKEATTDGSRATGPAVE
ncbi:MAG: hypothetical protein M3N98_12305, partial [Actinomycetota bacterium]|nr:hypothetical protein [Actinomycetota bacterium]